MTNNIINPISINQISKNFDSKLVLDNINLEVKAGECLGLIGLNGIGKTTLMKLMLNLLKPDQGNIKLFGLDNNDNSSRKKLVFLPEKFTPSPYLKGKEFIELFISYHDQQYDDMQVKELAKKLDFDLKYLDKTVNQYSKGMAQKIGLIATFLSNTSLLILDEPMSGLDPKARIELKKMLKEYHKKGNTIFFSSHIMLDIDEICDKIAILHAGNIRYLGTPTEAKELYNKNNLEEVFLEIINNTVHENLVNL